MKHSSLTSFWVVNSIKTFCLETSRVLFCSSVEEWEIKQHWSFIYLCRTIEIGWGTSFRVPTNIDQRITKNATKFIRLLVSLKPWRRKKVGKIYFDNRFTREFPQALPLFRLLTCKLRHCLGHSFAVCSWQISNSKHRSDAEKFFKMFSSKPCKFKSEHSTKMFL